MSFQGDPVALCIQAFLDDLANNVNGLQTAYVMHRQDAIESWFAANPDRCSDEEARNRAKAVLISGNFEAAKRHLSTLSPVDPENPENWLFTIWLI